MTDQINPAFHAELIVVFFNDYKDLRKVAERVGVLLSDASAEHRSTNGPSASARWIHRGGISTSI